MGKIMKNFAEVIIKIINDFFDNHLQLCLDMVESLAYFFSIYHPLGRFEKKKELILSSFLKFNKKGITCLRQASL
jgi:hypothetical protein